MIITIALGIVLALIILELLENVPEWVWYIVYAGIGMFVLWLCDLLPFGIFIFAWFLLEYTYEHFVKKRKK